MTRHLALQDLSRDHHAVLLHAKRLGDAAGRDSAVAAARAFLAYWDRSMLHHMREEHDHVLAACRDDGLVGQVRTVAQDLEFLVDLLRFSVLDTTTLSWNSQQLADGLRRHVRLLEWEVFDEIQEDLSEARMKELGTALLAFRREVRPDAIGPNAKEECFLGHAFTPTAAPDDFESAPAPSPSAGGPPAAGARAAPPAAPRPAPASSPRPPAPTAPPTAPRPGAPPGATRPPGNPTGAPRAPHAAAPATRAGHAAAPAPRMPQSGTPAPTRAGGTPAHPRSPPPAPARAPSRGPAPAKPATGSPARPAHPPGRPGAPPTKGTAKPGR